MGTTDVGTNFGHLQNSHQMVTQSSHEGVGYSDPIGVCYSKHVVGSKPVVEFGDIDTLLYNDPNHDTKH